MLAGPPSGLSRILIRFTNLDVSAFSQLSFKVQYWDMSGNQRLFKLSGVDIKGSCNMIFNFAYI